MGSTPNAYHSEPLSSLVIGLNKLCSVNKQTKQTNKFYFMSVFVTKYIRLLMLKTLAAMAIITDHTPFILIN